MSKFTEIMNEIEGQRQHIERLTDEMIDMRVHLASEIAVNAAFAHYDRLYNDLLIRLEHLEAMQ